MQITNKIFFLFFFPFPYSLFFSTHTEEQGFDILSME